MRLSAGISAASQAGSGSRRDPRLGNETRRLNCPNACWRCTRCRTGEASTGIARSGPGRAPAPATASIRSARCRLPQPPERRPLQEDEMRLFRTSRGGNMIDIGATTDYSSTRTILPPDAYRVRQRFHPAMVVCISRASNKSSRHSGLALRRNRSVSNHETPDGAVLMRHDCVGAISPRPVGSR